MIMLAKIGNSVLPPFIIFKRFVATRLMNQYQMVAKGTIVCTENYWMTSYKQ